MECRYFGECGSCTLYDMDYRSQLEYKKENFDRLLGKYIDTETEIFPSPQSHYRARAEFRVWHDEEGCSYAMNRAGTKGVVKIGSCPKVIEPIAEVMGALMESIGHDEELRKKLFAIEFLSGTAGETLVSMLYHRKLQTEWRERAEALAGRLGVGIIGRSRKQKIVLEKDYVTERLEIEGREYIYRHYEGGFTQPNPFVNTMMISWAKRVSADIGSDLLEAYCGLGNFTIPLAGNFDKVLATEISKNSIRAARENSALNSVKNIEFVRMSSLEMTEAIEKRREFRRMKDIALEEYDFKTILVDPPRAGLDEATLDLASSMRNILYISCNPETLARDLAILSRGHEVVEAAIFDQFPHTAHMECGVLLKKRAS